MSTTSAIIPSTTTIASIYLQEIIWTTSSMDLSTSALDTENSVSGIDTIMPSTISSSDVEVATGSYDNTPLLTLTVDHHIPFSAAVSEYPAATQNSNLQLIFILALSSLVTTCGLVLLAIIAVSIFLLHRKKNK